MSASAELPLFHVVGFTGHRHMADAAGVATAIRTALTQLRQEVRGNWITLSSVAAGSDQVFVREARALGLSWHAILPLPRAEFARDFSPVEWPRVEELLAGAEDVRIITENGTREDAYLDCGMETVNSSDLLLALWDGQPARGRGGTADVIAYARELGRPLVLIDAATHALTRENFAAFKTEDAYLASLNKLPEARTDWAANPFKAPEEIFLFQQKCDHAATRGAPQFRRLTVSTVLLHVAATVVATAGVAFDLHWLPLP
ncbi:MAG: hypothetical protein ACHQ5A_00395, partial [Opitutales bacterium]